MTTFNESQALAPWRTGIRVQQVHELLVEAFPEPLTCKEIGVTLGIDITVEENLKDISNRCGYLRDKGLAERLGQGTYRAINKEGTAMTTLDSVVQDNGLASPSVLEAPGVTIDPSDKLQCQTCGFIARSDMGLKNHVTRQHRRGITPDQAFERVGLACEMLFPDGIPMSRIIEIAELQKQMLKVISK